tara:strand:- start:1430 stop:1651 length:222 start_codon:yes stop_codon:yes gene_type:complete
MAFTRQADNGLVGIIAAESDGKFSWYVKEKFTGATVDSKTGDQTGVLLISSGTNVADYDTAAAELKAAYTAAG